MHDDARLAPSIGTLPSKPLAVGRAISWCLVLCDNKGIPEAIGLFISTKQHPSSGAGRQGCNRRLISWYVGSSFVLEETTPTAIHTWQPGHSRTVQPTTTRNIVLITGTSNRTNMYKGRSGKLAYCIVIVEYN